MTVYTGHQVFSEAFSVFRSMQDSRESIDCIVRGELEDGEDGEDEGVECHKLVLSAVSPYFRAMFRNQDSKDIKLHGVQSETLRSLVNYCYTGGSRLADERMRFYKNFTKISNKLFVQGKFA